jgi:diguanylate cyclase (GGDEF)-like protein
MLAYASNVFSAAARRFLAQLSSSDLALPLWYAIGLAASHGIGDGAAGRPLLSIGAPVAIGILARLGRGLRRQDMAQIAAAHVVVSLLYGEPAMVLAIGLARDLAEIACAILIFSGLRKSFVRSPVRLMAAVAIMSIVAPLAALPFDLYWEAPAGAVSLSGLGAGWIVEAVSISLVVGLIMTEGRESGPASPATDEPQPGLLEYVAAGMLLGSLTLATAELGRVEAALGASAVLLWFSLRLGLFATNAVAFAFTAAMLVLGQGGRWPALLSVADPIQTEMLRYLVLALLTAPSIVVATVVHDQQRLKRMFAYRAMHDGLTTLVNRSRFLEKLDLAAAAARARQERFVLLLVDLDYFKSVNDNFGHARGDKLLIEVARRLRASVRSTDVVARLGGDEFAIIAPVPAVDDAMRLARRLVEGVNQLCDLDGVAMRPSITVGGVLAPDSATDPEHLMLLADEALYEAKAAGRNCWRFSTQERAPAKVQPSWLAPGEVVETVFLD